jgi:hypothetical protein
MTEPSDYPPNPSTNAMETPAAQGGQATVAGWFLGLFGGILIGLIWAWWAEVVQSYVAPLVLFPLLIGAGAGITVVGLVRIAQIGHRPTIFATVLLAAIVAALIQHYFTYLNVYYWRRPLVLGESSSQDLSVAVHDLIPSFDRYIQAQVARGRTLFFGYQAQGGMVWTTWTFDALLTLFAAVAVILPAIHTPYCDRCRSWYRVTRNGKIDVPTAERLAAWAKVVLPDNTRSRRYRLSNCHGGCSATCCELSWEDAAGRLSLVQFWLNAAERAQVVSVLDQVASNTDDEDDDS